MTKEQFLLRLEGIKDVFSNYSRYFCGWFDGEAIIEVKFEEIYNFIEALLSTEKVFSVWEQLGDNSPILVKDDCNLEWQRRYLKKTETKRFGEIKTYQNGKTGWTADDKVETWMFAKLP